MCIFCKIVKGELPSNKVLENDDFIAFHDIKPIAPVHILIIPKVHVDCFHDMPDNIVGQATPFIKEVAQKMNLHKSGYRVVINNGDDAGQEVKHLHFHILGGTKLKWDRLDETIDRREFL